MTKKGVHIRILQDLEDKPMHICEDAELLIYLTRTCGTDKNHIMFTCCSFCNGFSTSLQVTSDKYFFITISFTRSTRVLLDKRVYLNYKIIT